MRDLVNEENKTCMEQKCIIEHEGKQYESGGAFIGINKKTGKHGGIVYGDWKQNNIDMKIVSNWHGDIKIPAKYGRVYRSNFGDKRCSVTFTWKGIKFHGIWCGMDNSQIIRIKEIK